MSRLRILFLSGGSLVGRNVLATLVGRRDALALIATSSVADEPTLFEFDAAYLVPPTLADPPAFERRLLAVIERETPDLVVPGRDDDVLFLAGLRQRRPDLAPRLLVGNLATAEAVTDKWRSYEFCRGHDLPFADSLVRGAPRTPAQFARDCGWPLVAKPRRGFSSRDILIVTTEHQLERALERDGCVVQQFLGDARRVTEHLAAIEREGIPLTHSFQGHKHSIQVCVAPDGATVHVICTQNVRPTPTTKLVRPDGDPDARALGERCARVFSAAGWRGPLNIQCQRDASGQLRIHEFNGRFSGATADRWLLGFDEVGATLAAFTGRALQAGAAPLPRAEQALEGLASRAVDPLRIAALARDGVWRARP
jgi:carbamoylphosphate synthase large subunit